MSSEHPLFEIVTTKMGAISIRNKVVNEIMHNPVGPWAEANALYIETSKLREKLLLSVPDELVVFDVGLGAAANSLATLHCAHSIAATESPRILRLISFEKDLELLRFALAHSDQFEHFRGYEPALKQLLETRKWSDGRIFWELREGDFLDQIEHEPFKAHLIFFDPYSPKQNKEMWGVHSFRKIRKKSRLSSEGGTLLFTYSRATPIRTALLASEFFVGIGPATGAKDETTQASTVFSDLQHPLPASWLERWKKSQAPLPFDWPEADLPQLSQVILNHEQFAT